MKSINNQRACTILSTERQGSAHLRGEKIRDNTVIRYLKREEKRREEDVQCFITCCPKRIVSLIYPRAAVRMFAFDISDRWP